MSDPNANKDDDAGPGDDEGWVEDIFEQAYTADCPDFACSVVIRFDADDLADCFGFDPVAYPGVGWPSGSPPEFDNGWCNPEIETFCDYFPVNLSSAPSTVSPSCDCVSLDQITDGCCEMSLPLPVYSQWETNMSTEFLVGASACELRPEYAFDSCELTDPVGVDECSILEGFGCRSLGS